MSGFKLGTISIGPYGRGFSVRFANDYVVSVQFGPKNNCSVKNESEDDVVTLDNLDETVDNAEVSVYDTNGEPVIFNSSGDESHPFTTPEKLVTIMTWAMRRSNDTKN
tara:strand:+ start:393 stop:716 length:324 start_codon:yes stop_codon:yes gene_type:complete